jgi:hypothetical protein
LNSDLTLTHTRGRRRKYLLGGALTLTTLLAVTMGFHLAPKAHAESGRRICIYGDTDTGGKHTWNVVDFDRDPCPRVWSSEVNTRGGEAQQVTCEDFTALLGNPANQNQDLGTDACPKLANDDVYQVTKDDAVNTYSYTSLGGYQQFQRSIRFDAKLGVGHVYDFCATTYDAAGKTLNNDCDKVGVGGTSRLFYAPGTVKVAYNAKPSGNLFHDLESSADVTGGRSYCIDAKYNSKGTSYKTGYC